MTLHLAFVYHDHINRPAYAAGVLVYSVVVAAALYPLIDLLLFAHGAYLERHHHMGLHHGKQGLSS